MLIPTRWPVSILVACCVLAGCTSARKKSAQPGVRLGGAFKLVHQNLPETLDPQRIVFLSDYEYAAFIYEGLVGYGDKPTSIQPDTCGNLGKNLREESAGFSGSATIFNSLTTPVFPTAGAARSWPATCFAP